MGVKERYEKRKKDGEKSVYNGVKQRYLSNSAEDAASSISDRVNTWLKNHDTYISNYRYRYGDRKNSYDDSYVSDSGSYLDTVTKQKSAFDAEADSILSYMDQYKDYFNSEWVDSVRNAISSARDTQKLVVEGATSDNDWWNSFGTDELVKQYGSAEKAYQYFQRDDGYRKKYSGQKSSELLAAVDGLEDGEEKDWLKSYASSVDRDEKGRYDLEAGNREVAVLENALALYKELSRWEQDEKGEAKLAQLRQQYGSIGDLESLISQKKAYITQAGRVQEGNRLAGVADSTSKYYDPAFSQYTSYVDDGKTPFIPDYKDVIYDAVNSNADTSKIATGQAWNRITGSEKDKLEAVKKMTKDEIGIYNYYYSKYGYDAAEEYLDSIVETLYGRSAAELYQPMEGKTALEMAFGIAAGLDQANSGLKSLFSGDDYIPASPIQQASGLVREDLEDVGPKLPDWMGGSSIGQGAYDAITTTANMAPSIMLSTAVGALNPAAGAAVGNLTMGASAAGNAYQEALNLGYDKGQARAYSTLVGASEVGLQYLIGGIGKLGGKLSGKAATSLASKFDNAYARLAVKYGANMLSEGAEEYLQEVLTPVFKNLTLKTDEEVSLISEDAIYSFLLGAITSGFMEGTGISSENGKGLIGNLKDMSSKNEANIKAAELYGNSTAELIQEGLESDPNSESYQLAEMFQRKTDKGKSMTGYEIRQQVEANEAQFAVEDFDSAVYAAKEKLTKLGETEDVDKLAKLVAKRATGQELTRTEKSTLARSQFGAKVAKEMATPTVETQNGTKAYNAKYKSLEERVGTEGRFGVSESGQATIRETNEALDIGTLEVATVGDGQMTFKVAEDREVYAGDIDFADENQSFLVSAVSDIENITPAAATAIMHDVVDTSKPLGEQLNGIDEAYSYGFHGYSVEDMKAGNFAPNLSSAQMMSAYKLGQSARSISDLDADAPVVKMRTALEAKLTAEQKTAQQKARFKGDAEVYFMDGSNVVKFDESGVQLDESNERDQRILAGVNTAKFLSKLGIGGKYYFYQSYLKGNTRYYKDANGVEKPAPNGFYTAEDGSIYIDLNAGNEGQGTTLYTLGHELTHFVKDKSKKQFKILGELVTEAFDKTDMSMHDRVVEMQNQLSALRDKRIDYTEAYEEVVADAMSTMLSDGSFYDKIMEIKGKDKGLFNSIKEFFEKMIAKFREVYAELTPDQRDARDIREMKDMFDKIQTAFAEALVEASDNFQAALEAEAVESLGENAKVETNAAGELLIAANERGNVQVYSERTYLEGGREKLEKALRQNGHTKEEIEKTLSYVDDALDYIKILAAGYAKNMGYTNLSNHLLADIVTNVKTGKQVMSAIVNNGDYPVNIDLSLICKKRVAYMNLMGRLIRDGVFDKVNYDGAAIAEVNEILRENGFETACLGCFVESRRLQFQTWAETIVSEWNSEVEKRNPNAGSFGFAKGKMENLTDADIDALTRELESVKKNDQGNVNLGQGNSVTRMGRLLDALPSLQKKLTVEDLLTPEGLTALRKHDGSLFSIVKSRYGAASPKIVQDFNPYASEIAMLTFAQVKGITNNAVKGAQAYVTEVKNEYGKLKKDKGESKAAFDQRKKDHEQKIQDEAMRRYLYDIGGARIQSFSDFMIENVFDYIQIFADLAAKRLPLHGYTKEIVCMRLFGMTGAKWNGSLIAHVERSMGKEYAGLLPAGTKDGIPVTVNGKDYVIGFDDYARNVATGGKSFVQSIGMKDIIALQLDPRYSPYVGNITIGVSDVQILAMLDNPLFRMVIPYHSSGMLPMFAKLVGVDLYNDYTDYQNTTVRQYYDLDGNAVSELKNAKGESVKADTSYAFNAEIQKTKDARKAADNYLNWCAQRHPVYDGSKLVGYATFNPKFSSSPYGTDFTRHKNYYKLLEDFNTYDCITEASTVQGAVTMNLPSEANRLTEQQMVEYKKAMRETGIFTEKDIEKYAKKANMTFKDIIAAEVGNRANYAATQAPKWEATVKAVEAKLQKDYARDEKRSDRDYMDAVNRGDMKTAQRMVDETAKKAGFPVRLLHGTQKFGFTVTDTSLSDDKLSFFATSDVDTAKTYSSLGGKRGITEDADYDSIDEESAAHEENAKEKADELADKISHWAGYYGYVGGDYIHEYFRDIADDYERGHISKDEADQQMYEFADELIANGYSEDAYDGLEFWEWQEEHYEEADELYTEVSKTISAYFALADFRRNADSSGNYDLYANTDGLLVIEGNGAKWNNIKSDVLPDITSDEYKKYGYRGHWDKWTTRSISKYASDNGYRGVLFKNIYDDGGKSSSGVSKPADVYSFFYPQEQVKSADPVTYDDNGKVIPLSERFNAKNDDIRYSERDSAGNKLTKEQQEFFKDSVVRDENGNLLAVYHGTDADFTVFEANKDITGEKYYFAASRTWVKNLFKEEKYHSPKNIMRVYLNIKNPLDLRSAPYVMTGNEWIDYFDSIGVPISKRFREFWSHPSKNKISFGSGKARGNITPWHIFMFDGISGGLRDTLASMGYDGLVIYDKVFGKADNTAYVAFHQNQIKLTSNKKPTTDPDTRYSVRSSKVDTDGMSAEAKKIISNLEIRARFSGISKGEYASYSAERIERELSNSSSATQMDYAKSYIAWVNPMDFLYATTTSDAGRAQIEKEAGELDLERLRKQTQPIHLTVDFETGKIVGHEGRHRMIALQKAGVEKVAVIFDAWNDDRYNTKPVDMMRIGGQEFDRYHGGLDFYVHDMLPLSKRYADAAKKLFSEVDGSIKFSERNIGDASNRHLLANAFEGISKSSIEYKMIQEYKGHIEELNKLDEKLSDLNEEIHKIRFDKETPRDSKKLKELQDEAKEVAKEINKHDKRLLNMEASEPLRKVIDRERAKARDDARQKNKAAMDRYRLKKEVKQSELMRDIRETKAALKNQKNETSIMEKEFIRIAKAYEKLDAKSTAKSDKDTKAIADLKAALKEEAKKHRDDQKTWEAEFSRLMREYELADRSIDRLEEKIERQKQAAKNKVESRQKTELRHKIRKTIRDLDKILNRGNKKLNVKEDVQNVVTKALQAADILFTDNYGTYDMLRNGIGADLSDSEEALVKTCTRMLKDLDKMPTDGYDNFQARQEAERKLSYKMSNLKDVFARERKRLNSIKVSTILGELADAYASLEKSEQSYVQGAYTEAVHNFLKNLQSEVGGTIVKDMTKDQLEYVYAAYKMVLTTVRKANEMFNKELKMSREQLGNAVIQEVMNAGGVHGLWTKAELAASKADWNNMKPIWVANRIGSDTFGMLMKGLFEGQYNFAVDVEEAKQFKLSMDEKYKPRSWDAEKLYEFESSTGKKFSLNLQQIMSLYAFSKREQAYSHLLNGGFVFEGNSTVIVDEKGRKKTYIHNGATSYKLNEATLNDIISSLTKEQKAYVDEMQKYLSEVMGAKGNEVSMALYGIKMFKEQFYFPLRSSGAYMERAKEAEMKKQQGQINLVNSGFTHAVKPEAKNPIILANFMDVWAEHCNEMSMYHSMVLPMEDFRKVYNYSTVHNDEVDSASVFQTIQDAYGDAATAYIDQLYRELNAGATIDPRETTFKKLISNFKKTAVMLSASVVVQQFSSIGRAYALIDPKYFIGTRVNSDTQLSVAEEMRKYAPVAIIKEMGGFDTGTKGSAKSYITAEKYGKGEWLQGLKKDEQYRSDLMGILPAKADEKTWCAIWEAVKRETKTKHPKMDVKSEEFLKLAGERFSEVIEKTQVYDSVLARSANMRSKTGLMQMATSFMAEPTTTVNLIEDAIRRGDKKYMARAFGAVAVSIVLNNALASIVYAMRDDDEDETFIEKYFQSFTSGMIDDINPMSYYPFLKDVYSLFQGYDVERADMSVIADLRDALKKAISLIGKDTSGMDDDELAKHYKTVNSAILSLLDAGCSVFGVPLKNVRRDANGIINAWNTVGKDLTERDTSWNSFWDKVGAAAKDTIPIYAWTKDEPKQDKLYEAIVSGDKAYLARLKSTYKTDSAYQSAVRKALRENDSRIHEAAQAKYEGRTEEYKRIFREIQKEGKFSFDDIMSAVNSEEAKIRNGLEPDKVTSSYTASGFVEAVILGDSKSAEAMKEDIIAAKVANGKTPADAEKEFTSDVATGIRDAYSSGLLDEARAENMLMEYAGKDEEEAVSKVNYWVFCEKYPQYKLTESDVADYEEFAEPAEISLDVFVRYINGTKGLTTKYDQWGDVELTVREQTLEVIDSLPLTWQQKDALYLAAGYSESKIWDVPW